MLTPSQDYDFLHPAIVEILVRRWFTKEGRGTENSDALILILSGVTVCIIATAIWVILKLWEDGGQPKKNAKVPEHEVMDTYNTLMTNWGANDPEFNQLIIKQLKQWCSKAVEQHCGAVRKTCGPGKHTALEANTVGLKHYLETDGLQSEKENEGLPEEFDSCQPDLL